MVKDRDSVSVGHVGSHLQNYTLLRHTTPLSWRKYLFCHCLKYVCVQTRLSEGSIAMVDKDIHEFVFI